MRRIAAGVVLTMVVSVAGLASAAVLVEGNLRITVLSQVIPFKLPRTGTAPIAVFVSGHIGSRDGSVPPQLQRMTIDVNRHGLLDATGIPSCALRRIQTASTARALEECADSIVGSGRFWASVVFPAQRPYPTRGRLLVFYGEQKGKPALFAHIYTTLPVPTSFVVVFTIHHLEDGPYGTRLSASLPQTLGSWGFVDRIKLTLRRKFSRGGRQRSFFNAGCPALAGTKGAVFPLARARFYFDDVRPMQLIILKSCGVAG
jgi:hypothetical protein